MTQNKKFDYRKILIALGVYIIYAFMFVFVLHNTSELTDSLEPLRVGDIVKKSVFAHKNIKFIDEQETERRRREAVENSYSIYTRDDSKFQSSIYYLRQDLNYQSTDEKSVENYKRLELILNDIYKHGFFDVQELNRDKKDKIEFEGTIYQKSDVLTSHNIRNYILTHFKGRDDMNLSNQDENFIFNNVPRYLVANATYNVFETMERERQIRSRIEPVIVDIHAGDLVLVEDEIVTQQKYDKLMKIRSLEAQYTLTSIVFCLLFSSMAILLIFYVLARFVFSPEDMRESQHYYIASFAEMLFLFLSFLEFLIFIKTDGMFLNACAVMCLPCLIVLMSTRSKRCGYLLLILNALLFLLIPVTGWSYLFRNVCISIGAMELLASDGEHSLSVRNCMIMLLFAILVVAMTNLPNFTTLNFVFFDCIFEIIKLSVCYVVSFIVCILLQNILNIPTTSKLEKLANAPNALIDKFKSVCIGSFEHSQIVADIAENAARDIGANALLVKVAARFHDIGKMEHPEYFVENQKSGTSKHQVIKNKLSATIIKSHIPLGVKLLKENNFPPEVIQIVSQHHGNDLISYFYFEAKKDAGEGEEVEKSDYSYQSDIPSSKESGILMLSDISEAATRSQMNGMTEQQLRDFVHGLIQAKIQHGQLDNSTLTIGELRVIEESILSTLKAKFHKRIVYPKDEEKRG